jgi:transcriptional regulator with XRE-family HTH domain
MLSQSTLPLGSKLRTHRERRGVTLEALAESMKVKKSLLDELERNDLSHWPPGIYGRALVREYAKSVGLPPADMVQEFLHLFCPPEERCDQSLSAPERESAQPSPELRLTFAGAPTEAPEWMYRRAAAAAIELVIVLMTALLVAVGTALSMWTTTAIVALTWYPARAVLCGHDAFYRVLRLDRLTTSSFWPQSTELSPFADFTSMRTTGVGGTSGSGNDSFVANADVNETVPNAASVH